MIGPSIVALILAVLSFQFHGTVHHILVGASIGIALIVIIRGGR